MGLDFCKLKCCLKSVDVENEIECMNEKLKENFSVEEKEKDIIEED